MIKLLEEIKKNSYQMSFYTHKTIHTRLKVHASMRNISISKLLDRIINEYLEKYDRSHSE